MHSLNYCCTQQLWKFWTSECHIPSNLPDCFSLLPRLQEFAHALSPLVFSLQPVFIAEPKLFLESPGHLSVLHNLLWLFPDKITFLPLTLRSTSAAPPWCALLRTREPCTLVDHVLLERPHHGGFIAPRAPLSMLS